jgi:hypothetical protein
MTRVGNTAVVLLEEATAEFDGEAVLAGFGEVALAVAVAGAATVAFAEELAALGRDSVDGHRSNPEALESVLAGRTNAHAACRGEWGRVASPRYAGDGVNYGR